MAFQTGKIERKATLACIVYVGEFEAAKASRTEGSPYYSSKVQLKAAETAGPTGLKGMDIKTNFTFIPEFFKPGYNIDTEAGKFGDKARGVRFVYDKNIANADVTGLLQCAVGDAETFERLGGLFDGLGDHSAASVDASLRDFLADLGPVCFGVVLRQPDKKTDRVDEAGKAVYETSAFYEPDVFFRINKENIAKLVKRAEKNKEARAKAKAAGTKVPDRFELRFDPAQFSE